MSQTTKVPREKRLSKFIIVNTKKGTVVDQSDVAPPSLKPGEVLIERKESPRAAIERLTEEVRQLRERVDTLEGRREKS